MVRAAWHPAAPQLVKAAKRQKAKLYIAHYPAALRIVFARPLAELLDVAPGGARLGR
jgi:hypothetical protein